LQRSEYFRISPLLFFCLIYDVETEKLFMVFPAERIEQGVMAFGIDFFHGRLTA
jgi:hypothetical protein